jgi:hypothetical protein
MTPTTHTARMPASPIAAPEFAMLRDVRRALVRGRLPPRDARSPADQARIAAFRALEELLHVLDDYRRRVQCGERCRLVERDHGRTPGRLMFELSIEVER